MPGQTETLYHLAARADWDRRTAGEYRAPSLAVEGFIHCSAGPQVTATAARHYPGRSDLVLLTIDPAGLGSEVRWEPAPSGEQFPHVYGPIELRAVVACTPFPADDTGRYDWWRPDRAVVAHRQGRSTAAVHALLDHLADHGFDGGPRPLGIERGLSLLTYLPGSTADYPLPRWLQATEPLTSLGQLLRRAHDASATLAGTHEWLVGSRAVGPGEVVVHRDVGPGNVVWRDGQAVGLIDWEYAEPGDPLVDLVLASINLAGWARPSVHEAAGFPTDQVLRRLDALVVGYGRYTVADVQDAAADVIAAELRRCREFGAAGIEPWSDLVEHGVADKLTATLEWLEGGGELPAA